MIKTFFILTIIGFCSTAFAAGEDPNLCEDDCMSQLLRINVDNDALTQRIATGNMNAALLPSLKNYFDSDTFRKQFLTDYPMPAMGFPFNVEQCKADKARNAPDYRGVSCENTLLCSDPTTPQQVKNDLCFSLPCAMIKGSQNMGQCSDGAVARPTMINYPGPVSLKKMGITPTSVNIVGNRLQGCFTVDQLEVGVGIEVEFAEEGGVNYDKMGLDDLSVKLDRPRKICMSAVLVMNATKPISDVRIEMTDGNFVSDDMITKAAQAATVNGLTGYSPAAVNTLKLIGLPPLARHFRPTIEGAISKALANSFESQLITMIGRDGPQGISSITVPSDSMVSEIGVGNFGVKKYVDLIECSVMKAQGIVIQPEAPCLNQPYPMKGRNLKASEIPPPQLAAQLATDEMAKYDHVTSDAIRMRLIALGPQLGVLGLGDLYNRKISPIVNNITAQQRGDGSLAQGIRLVTQLNEGGSHTALGVKIPKICNTEMKSPHDGHSISNCPVQAYVDLEELNRLMDVMYKTGRLCHRGQGDYTPKRDNRGNQVYDGAGAPQGTGCLLQIEDSPAGMRCYLNGPPRLRFDEVSKGYKFEMKTKDCYRGPVIAGQGKIGGDINFDIGFVPSFCKGDFCLDQGKANWNVVPGSARYALRDSSFLSGMVKSTIDAKISDVLKDSIRIPLNQGPLGTVPLEAEGRVDKGKGYFGACLKYR